MRFLTKTLTLAAAAVTAASVIAGTPAFAQSNTQIAAVPEMTLPQVVIRAPADRNPASAPYTTGVTTRPSSNHAIPYQHYTVPTGYDADPWMTPYSTFIDLCQDADQPAAGCHAPAGPHIQPSHYERAPFNQ